MNGQNLEDASPVVWCELYAFSAVFRRAVIRTEKSRSCSKLIISHLGLQLGPSPSITHVSEGLADSREINMISLQMTNN